MTRGRRPSFPQVCTRRWRSGHKRGYGTLAAAEEALRATKADTPGKEFNVFLCRHCGGWHIGGQQEEAEPDAPSTGSTRRARARTAWREVEGLLGKVGLKFQAMREMGVEPDEALVEHLRAMKTGARLRAEG